MGIYDRARTSPLTETGRKRVEFNQKKEVKTFLVAGAKQCENNAVGEFQVQYGWSTMINADRKMDKSCHLTVVKFY